MALIIVSQKKEETDKDKDKMAESLIHIFCDFLIFIMASEGPDSYDDTGIEYQANLRIPKEILIRISLMHELFSEIFDGKDGRVMDLNVFLDGLLQSLIHQGIGSELQRIEEEQGDLNEVYSKQFDIIENLRTMVEEGGGLI